MGMVKSVAQTKQRQKVRVIRHHVTCHWSLCFVQLEEVTNMVSMVTVMLFIT